MTKIEWTEKSWNPVTGCTKVSPGCKNCYAEAIANRLWGGRKFTDVRCHEDRLDTPFHWKKPRRVFVNSMSDLFHPDVPFDFIDKVQSAMQANDRHTFQILTKRPERLELWIEYRRSWTDYGFNRHIWIGVSVESPKYLDRTDILRRVPAAIRFISFEPLLESVGEIDLTGIHWVIIGGESGLKARPFNIEWAREIIRQCKAAKVPVFMKQVGASPVAFTLQTGYVEPMKLKSRKGGDPNEWPVDLRIREYPKP